MFLLENIKRRENRRKKINRRSFFFFDGAKRGSTTYLALLMLIQLQTIKLIQSNAKHIAKKKKGDGEAREGKGR
jgi:hypothetical protein